MTSDKNVKCYKIAYTDKKGNGFGSLPYILDGYDDVESAIQEKDRLIREGYKNVVVFSCPVRIPEEINWEYVEKRLYKD